MELIGALFGQQDGENFVVDQLFDELRRFRQNLIEVQRGVDFLADLDEGRESFGGNLGARI